MSKLVLSPYHSLVLLLFQNRHSKARDHSPLNVEDVDRLVVLREQLDVVPFNSDLERVPG